MASISVIIPCYNVEEYIEEGLLSILAQTVPQKEIICIDDGSSDHTVEIIRMLQDKFPDRISLILNDTNYGATFSRNRGTEVATGDYLQFFDADDIILPNKFEKQLSLIQTASQPPDIIVNNLSRLSLDGEKRPWIFDERDLWVALIYTQIGVTTGNLYKREKVLEVNGWKEDLKSSQEYDMMFRMLQAGATVVFDDEILGIIRERPSGSITRSNPLGKWQRYIDLRISIYEYLVNTCQLTRERHQAYINAIFDAIRILYKLEPELAYHLYKTHIRNKGEPDATDCTSRKYLSALKLFGFKTAEFLSRLSHPRQNEVY